MSELDPKLTFEAFVVGPANRLASAAARRAAETPGTSYNPLFLYSASGLGKTHILTAIAHQARRSSPGCRLVYMELEKYLERLEEALEGGERDGMSIFEDVDLLLLDDVQFLTGQQEAQEMLLRALDRLSAADGQIVLASDRPPADIDGLDARLLSRFSGGLIVDIAPPEYETRVAIIRRKAEERGGTLETGVAEALGRRPFRNVRELGGALNRILATQELEERRVFADEVPLLLGDAAPGPEEGGQVAQGEFDTFLDDLLNTVAEVVEDREEPWRKAFREAIDQAEREGFTAARLATYAQGSEPDAWREIVDGFRADVERLRAIEEELAELGNPWPDAAAGVLRDPDRLQEAESLLTSVRERQRPFPRLARGQTLEDLEDFPKLARKAATQLVGPAKPQYNPLFVWSTEEDLAKTLLGATGRSYPSIHSGARMAVTSVREFAEDFIRALGEGVAGAWRERWWTLDLLLVHGVQTLSETERAQDEFFHLFEALKRRGARVMLVADRAPAAIRGIDDRLRSRFEGGLVLQLEDGTPGGDLILEDQHESLDARLLVPGFSPTDPRAEEGAFEPVGASRLEGGASATFGAPRPAAPTARGRREPSAGSEPWYPSPENVVIHWPRMADLLIEELEA